MMPKLNCKVDGDNIIIARRSLEAMYSYLSCQLENANKDKTLESLANLIAGRRMMIFEILQEFK